MKLQNLTVIFIIIVLPIILIVSLYISTGLKTIEYQSLYDNGLLNATHDAIYAFEQNTANDNYSDNPEVKRDILKASIKMFEKSLCNTCRISSYNIQEIESYIPAIVFGMYDGFYMYSPSIKYNENTGKKEYTHSLKNYVYYSEFLEDDMMIRYSLDNYVVVSGYFNGAYQVKAGYLIVKTNWENYIDENDVDANDYYDDAIDFTQWFNANVGNKIEDENSKRYLYIDSNNDPEDENSKFVQHKRNVIKKKIESVLNSSITAYAERLGGYTYKMPKLSEEDWEKIYNNISMITFFQGKNIGLTQYNGYCVLNSTNNSEYVNSNLIYFTDEEGYYHDIRCEECTKAVTLTGYKIGSFRKRKVEKTDDNGEVIYDSNGNIQYKYIYVRNELACYNCVNGQLSRNMSVSEYVGKASAKIKKAYYTSLARERYNVIKYK